METANANNIFIKSEDWMKENKLKLMCSAAYMDSEDYLSFETDKQMMQGRVEMTGREKSLKSRKGVWLESSENTLSFDEKRDTCCSSRLQEEMGAVAYR